MVGLNFLSELNYEVRSAERRILVEKIDHRDSMATLVACRLSGKWPKFGQGVRQPEIPDKAPCDYHRIRWHGA
jgi:hypothetical protein